MMTTKLQNQPITTFQEGDQVAGFGLLTKKALRQDKNGRDYLDMQIVDASGSIVAKAWSDSRALNGDYECHDFVAYAGSIQRFRDQLQLNVKDCRRATESDRQRGFDPALIIPSTKFDIDELASRLDAIFEQHLERPELLVLARTALDNYGPALREHPAAKSIHHAYRGGLLEHVVSMAELAVRVCAHYPEVDRDLVLVGVLFHDLGKLVELGAMPVNDYTPTGRLVGHVVIGRDLLREQCTAVGSVPPDIQLHLEHLVLSHQGRQEFGSPIPPMTAEALVLHFIDDLDSKLAQLREARQSGESLRYFTGFGRYLYTEIAPAEEDSSTDRPTSEEAEDSTEGAEQSALDL